MYNRVYSHPNIQALTRIKDSVNVFMDVYTTFKTSKYRDIREDIDLIQKKLSALIVKQRNILEKDNALYRIDAASFKDIDRNIQYSIIQSSIDEDIEDARRYTEDIVKVIQNASNKIR